MVKEFKWTTNKERAAWEYARGDNSNEEIYTKAKVCEATFYSWLKEPAFVDRVEGHVAFMTQHTKMNHARIENIVTRKIISMIQRPGVGIRELTRLAELYSTNRIEITRNDSMSNLSDGELRRELEIMDEERKREKVGTG